MSTALSSPVWPRWRRWLARIAPLPMLAPKTVVIVADDLVLGVGATYTAAVLDARSRFGFGGHYEEVMDRAHVARITIDPLMANTSVAAVRRALKLVPTWGAR